PSAKAGRDINDTTDTGAFNTPNFGLATGPCPATGCVNLGTGGPIEPFLRWNATAPAPPAGFLSDGVTPHGVTGSPTGNNFFRVQRPGIRPTPIDPATACPAPLTAPDCAPTTLFLLNAPLPTPLAPTTNQPPRGAQA